MKIMVWIGVKKLYYQSGLLYLYAPLQYNFSRTHIEFQKCDNDLLVVALDTLGMMPATSLGLVRQGWRKGISKMPSWGFY